MNVRRYFSVHDFDAKRQRVNVLSNLSSKIKTHKDKQPCGFTFVSNQSHEKKNVAVREGFEPPQGS